MVLAGNVIGASAIARTQLERWSSNRATSNGLSPGDGASTAEYYTKIWRNEGPRYPAGVVWQDLSELLHGRGNAVDAARWESWALCDPTGVTAVRPDLDKVQAATQLALRQVRLCVATLAEPLLFRPGFVDRLRALPLSLPAQAAVTAQVTPLLWPMTLEVLQLVGPSMSAARQAYRRDVEKLASRQTPRPINYSGRAYEAFVERRSRATAGAISAFDFEREQLGVAFNPRSLAEREFAYVIINEVAGLLSGWTPRPQSDALAAGASALRASFWLWLEDDDRALVLARTTLEQTARLRTWRLKPSHAQKLEDRGTRTSTRDWLQEAGWRRLSVLNRSLAEFAHANPDTARWAGARRVLATLQPPDAGPPSAEPLQVARGGTLNAVAFAFGAEIMESVTELNSELASALTVVLPDGTVEDSPWKIDEWLERCWRHRGHSFGESEFAGIK